MDERLPGAEQNEDLANRPVVIEYFAPDAADTTDGAATRGGELNAMRIRHVAAMRRGAYRGRSYCIVAAVFCAAISMHLVWLAYHQVRHFGWQLRPITYVFASAAAAVACRFFFRRAVELSRELRKPATTEPSALPDFSTLSDGSQQWKNLEAMQNVKITEEAAHD
jgi:hypothetical protein